MIFFKLEGIYRANKYDISSIVYKEIAQLVNFPNFDINFLSY